jgi:hypothetical protein
MNYAMYMRKIAAGRTTTIGFQNGQDASQVTYKAQARANTIKTPVAVATSFSQVGGGIANILEGNQQNSSPTSAVCASGYQGVSQSQLTTTYDGTNSVIGAAQHCAVCSDAPSSEPYNIVIPCGVWIDPPQNAPGTSTAKCCVKDAGILFTDNRELVQDQGRQQTLRQSYNLPSKLQGLRGPVVTNR